MFGLNNTLRAAPNKKIMFLFIDQKIEQHPKLYGEAFIVFGSRGGNLGEFLSTIFHHVHPQSLLNHLSTPVTSQIIAMH